MRSCEIEKGAAGLVQLSAKKWYRAAFRQDFEIPTEDLCRDFPRYCSFFVKFR